MIPVIMPIILVVGPLYFTESDVGKIPALLINPEAEASVPKNPIVQHQTSDVDAAKANIGNIGQGAGWTESN